MGDFERPLMISRFVADLNSGFRLLNLKNDGLRKRFDALKYDVKKIEEVVYDISIRGLRSNSEPSSSSIKIGSNETEKNENVEGSSSAPVVVME